MRVRLATLLLIACAACSENQQSDDGGNNLLDAKDSGPSDRASDPDAQLDAADPDATELDAEAMDAEMDASEADAEMDASEADAEELDAEPMDGTDPDALDLDAEPEDADGPLDADAPDADPADALDPDATPADTGVVGIAALNDEFDDATTLPNWTLRDVAEQTPAQYGTLDIDTTTSGHLTIIPSQSSFWGNADRGFYLYKTVTGDFIMHAYVRAVQVANPAIAPTFMFNSVGVMARDPASPTSVESWVMMTMGYQASTIGTRAASTNNSSTNQSAYLASTVSYGEVVICRIGADFWTYYTTPNKGGLWTRTAWFVRNDLPQTLQVGIAADAFLTQPHLRAEVDWIRFAVPAQMSDCTQAIPPN